MTLIKPNTIVSFVDGAPFYGTHHKWSDIDIISVEMMPLERFLSGIRTKPKQKHGLEWSGKSVDITRYEVDHFLGLLAKGNIQMIEKVLMAKDEHFVYQSQYWLDNDWRFRRLAEHALQFTTWGHIRGWMHKTINKIEMHGMDVKKAVLMYRFIIEARTFMNTGEFVCQYPALIEHAKDKEEKDILQILYDHRKAGKEIDRHSIKPIEHRIFQEVRDIEILFDNYKPNEEARPMLIKDDLITRIRTDQVKEGIRRGYFK
jgi:predicted nucleotidyltransferase